MAVIARCLLLWRTSIRFLSTWTMCWWSPYSHFQSLWQLRTFTPPLPQNKKLTMVSLEEKIKYLTPTHIQYPAYFTDLPDARLWNFLYFPRLINCLFQRISQKKLFDVKRKLKTKPWSRLPFIYFLLGLLFLGGCGSFYSIVCSS